MGGKTTGQTLIYLHIPKCAGTSVMQVLKASYGAGFHRIPNGGGWRRFRWAPGITCLTGHIPWSIGGAVPGPKRYAVMLRNPVYRVASLYWFCRSFKKHRYHRLASTLNLTSFVESKAFSDLDNGMVRWLAGRRDVGSLKRKRQPLTEDDLKLAMTHVAVASVGFVNTFERDMYRWAREFGWSDATIEHKMTQNYPSPTQRERGVIAQHNRLDMALYEYALGIAK